MFETTQKGTLIIQCKPRRSPCNNSKSQKIEGKDLHTGWRYQIITAEVCVHPTDPYLTPTVVLWDLCVCGPSQRRSKLAPFDRSHIQRPSVWAGVGQHQPWAACLQALEAPPPTMSSKNAIISSSSGSVNVCNSEAKEAGSSLRGPL